MTIQRRTPPRRTVVKKATTVVKRSLVGSKPGPRLKTRLMGRCDEKARERTYRRAGVQLFGARRIPATGKCECCGENETATDAIEWAHSFPRARRMCRWEEWGAFGIKKSHHQRYSGDPEGWRAFLISRWGEETYWERYRLSQTTFGGSITVAFYREKLASLSAQLEQVKREAA